MSAITAARDAILAACRADTGSTGLANANSPANVRSGFHFAFPASDAGVPNVTLRISHDGDPQDADNQSGGGSYEVHVLNVACIVKVEIRRRDDDQGSDQAEAIADRLRTVLHTKTLATTGWSAAPMIRRSPAQGTVRSDAYELPVRFTLTLSRQV